MSDNLPVVGWLERVWFPDFKAPDEGVVAKIDTGADSGALHCVFERVVKDEEGKEWLEFQPLEKSRPVIRTDKFKRIVVRSSNSTIEERHRVETKIKILGQEYPIKLTLSDRTDMKYQVIIGWRFLENRFLVDVSKTNI